MFIGREKELAFLNEQYETQRSGCVVLYGRRRVGKTALVTEFLKDKRAIMISAVEGRPSDNLKEISRAIAEYQYGLGTSSFAEYSDFQTALRTIAKIGENKHLVLFIDELPYLAKSIESSLSILQHFLDKEAKEAGIFVILSGSSISFMEEKVLSEKSPVFGRRTAQMKLLPFDYLETGMWFPSYTSEEKAFVYGITGGIPYYLECFYERPIREAIEKSILSSNGLLFAEPTFLLRSEMKESKTYESILNAIATGSTRLTDISSAVGIDSGLCTGYINGLIELGLVRKENPIKGSERKSMYRIDDLFLLFYYRFVYRFSSIITFGRGKELYEKIIEPQINDYMGLVFERMVKDYIGKYASLPFLPKEIGRWWGGNPRTKKEAEIDVVVLSAENDNEGIVASCKYRNREMDIDEFYLMEDYALAMNIFREKYYWMFSKSGFSNALIEKEGDRVSLFTLDDLYTAE